MSKIDFSKGYGKVCGHPKAHYAQNHKLYDAAGNELSPEQAAEEFGEDYAPAPKKAVESAKKAS